MRLPPQEHRWLQQRSQGGEEAETRARCPGGRPLTAPQLGEPPQERPGLWGLLQSGLLPVLRDHCRSQEEREGSLSELAFFSKQNDTGLGWTT